MKREIKFRAWNTEMNNMVFPSLEFGREIWPCTYRRITSDEFDKDGFWTKEVVTEMVSVDHILQSPEFDVMQFTGLLDKNDKEIYEGDILEYKNDFGKHFKHNVFYVDGGFAINTHQSDFGNETPFYDACADMQTAQYIEQCEVIGNIYEPLNQ
jgi:uncharacterized phage protein (TIGR01671 family)